MMKMMTSLALALLASSAFAQTAPQGYVCFLGNSEAKTVMTLEIVSPARMRIDLSAVMERDHKIDLSRASLAGSKSVWRGKDTVLEFNAAKYEARLQMYGNHVSFYVCTERTELQPIETYERSSEVLTDVLFRDPAKLVAFKTAYPNAAFESVRKLPDERTKTAEGRNLAVLRYDVTTSLVSGDLRSTGPSIRISRTLECEEGCTRDEVVWEITPPPSPSR